MIEVVLTLAQGLPRLGDVIASKPEAFFSSCLVIVPIAIWWIIMVRGMVGGEVEAGPAIGSMLLSLLAIFVASNPPMPWVAPAITIMMFITVIAYPLVGPLLNRVALREVDYEAIERMYQQLEEKDVPSVRMRMARYLGELGHIAHASALSESSLAGLPPQFYTQEIRELDRWKETIKHHPHLSEIPNCFRCGASVQAGQLHCVCKARIMLDHARGNWGANNALKRLTLGWLLVMGLLLAVVAATSYLPPAIALISILAALAAGIAGGIKLFRT